MPRHLIYIIVFIEGFCSLGAEVIALRRLLPHVGSSITVTAPTIGFFLLALALGYASGARVAAGYRAVVMRNFLISATLVGLGLARVTVELAFEQFRPALAAYFVLILLVLCPIAWLLGQTVPILTNLMKHERTGEASGTALYWSTLGSFLGSVTLSLVVMQHFGVSAAVFACAAGLFSGAVLLAGRKRGQVALAGALLVTVAAVNFSAPATLETAYADYSVVGGDGAVQDARRIFVVNQQQASALDDGEPPRYLDYVEHLRKVLLDELQFAGREILVLGAGGFTLSQREGLNHYTYVDIDPAIRAIAEEHFLQRPVNGAFIDDDARRYLSAGSRQYDAIVVDAFSSHTSIPSHLVTREFWLDALRALSPEGVLIANLVLDGRLRSPYARNMLATIESVFGRCAVEVLHKARPSANVEVVCFAGSPSGPATLYVDEKNSADLDRARSAAH